MLCRTAKLSSDVCDIHDSISAISVMWIWWFSRSQRSRAEVFRKERSSDVRTTARRKDLLILARVFFKVDSDICDICAMQDSISAENQSRPHMVTRLHEITQAALTETFSRWWSTSFWLAEPKQQKRTKAELRRSNMSNMSNMSNTTLVKCHSLKSEDILSQTYWM